MKKENGITLIALIITIIVLLILAGVAISMVIGNNGIVNKANNSVVETRKGEAKDIIAMAWASVQTDYLIAKTEDSSVSGESFFTVDNLNNYIKPNGEIASLEYNEDGESTLTYKNSDKNLTLQFEVDKNGNVTELGVEAEVTELKVVANSDGSGDENSVAKNSMEEGTSLYISFKASIEGGTVQSVTCSEGTVTKNNNMYVMEVTKNGKYTFIIQGTVNGTKSETEYTVTVDKYAVRAGIKVGDYVTYTAPTREDYELTSEVSGYGYAVDKQTLGQEYTTWRVLNINNDGSMDLVAAVTSSNKTIYFKGALGYNNGVYALNDMCSYLYENEAKGITARSLNIEDIESHFSEAGETAKNNYISNEVSSLSANSYIESVDTTNNTVTYKMAYYYPLIYKYQIGAGINTEDVLKENDEYENGKKAITESDPFYSTATTDTYAEAADNLTVEQTYYYVTQQQSYYDDYNGSTSNFYKALFQTGTYYWLASRYSRCTNGYAYFGLRLVGSNDLNGNNMFFSDIRLYVYGNRVCPVVSLSSDIKVTKCSGTNSSSNTHTVVVP